MLKKTPATRDPLEALMAAPQEAVLAVIAGVEGPSYRPLGAMMTVLDARHRVGTLSSGCIEADISLHAIEAAKAGQPKLVRYGRGSPFIDIQLPCGGGLDILLVPEPDREALATVMDNRAARRPCSLLIDMDTGGFDVTQTGATGRQGTDLIIRFEPEIRFLIFGKGPEASTFAGLVQSAGYPNLLMSPDPETLDHATAAGCETQRIREAAFPPRLRVDDRTAVVLFFHDHDWEPQILDGALKTSAFYIGAQGSQRARDARLAVLQEMGVSHENCARLHGPVGLIPSARDAGTLSVSVLAEVLAKAMANTG
ncbi:MAG: XdhC family protein [Pseudomonadota bacterium]